MDTNKTQQAGQTGDVTTAETVGPNPEAGKTFTQEDVNRIVSERLAREREKPDERERQLSAREARLTCREYLLDMRAPDIFLDVLDTSDPDKFKAAVKKLQAAGYGAPAARPTKSGMSHQGGREVGSIPDEIAKAFRPKV